MITRTESNKAFFAVFAFLLALFLWSVVMVVTAKAREAQRNDDREGRPARIERVA